MKNKNCLSYWLPLLRDAGLPVPRTEIVRTECDLSQLLDGQTPEGFGVFIADLADAANCIGLPCFLRTGQTSNKHEWSDTCYLASADHLVRHVVQLVEFSAIADFLGLPTDVWAVRELLPTNPLLHVYRGMPAVREFRCFVEGGEVFCVHPYWPKESLIRGLPMKWPDAPRTSARRLLESQVEYEIPEDFDWKYECLCHLPAIDEKAVLSLASDAGKALGGAWSVDILETARGWYVTDCAKAAQSFHWEGCRNARRFA